MEKSNLIPFLRHNLDILFVGLNPAKGSSRNRHYFSVNQAFWDQLYESGLITKCVDKSNADEIVFGSATINFNSWGFGITDLVTSVAESDSSKINPSLLNCQALSEAILTYTPPIVILLHGKVLDKYLQFLKHSIPEANAGFLGKLIPDCLSTFYTVAFPHGNAIFSSRKVQKYMEVKSFLTNLKGDNNGNSRQEKNVTPLNP